MRMQVILGSSFANKSSKISKTTTTTNANGCRIFGDQDQLKSNDTMQKNGRLYLF